MKTVAFTLNGKHTRVEIEPGEPLLYVLRDGLKLDGPKFGCGLGQCGACTVLLNGNAIRSCVYPAEAASGTTVTTIEGLGDAAHPHPVQEAFITEQAAQCGYCTNGMVVASTALLRKNPKPSTAQIKNALSGNLCRCACQLRVVRAVRRVAEEGRRV